MEFSFLPKTSLWNALSSLGRTVETPKGIFYWSARAAKESEIDGTIGIAQDDDGTISHLPIAEEWAGEKIMKRIPKAKIFGYAPIEGMTSLRQKWLARMLARQPELAEYASLPVVTNGITHSLALAGRLLLDPGQILITAEKSWENYDHIFTGVQGIKIKTFPLFLEKGGLNVAAIIATCREVAQKQKKVILLLNFPHNQTGFMPSSEQCEELAQALHGLCRELPQVPFVIVLDDAYEGYVYDEAGQKYSPLHQIFTQLPNLSIAKLDGISKVMLAYGYRIGFFTFFVNSLDGKPMDEQFQKGMREEAGTKIGGLVRGEISQTSHHSQILADALMDDIARVDKERSEVIARLGERWKIMVDQFGLSLSNKAWLDPCNGGFFCYLNLALGLDAREVADRLMKEKKVGVVPSGQGLRLAFAGVPKEKIPRMVEAVFEILSN